MSTPVGDVGDLPLADPDHAALGPEPQSHQTSLGRPQVGAVPFRLRPGPIAVVVFLAISFVFLPSLAIDLISDPVRLPVYGASLLFYFDDRLVMLLVALGLIALARRRSG